MVDLSVLNGLDLACRVYKNIRQAKRVGREGVIQGPKMSPRASRIWTRSLGNPRLGHWMPCRNGI